MRKDYKRLNDLMREFQEENQNGTGEVGNKKEKEIEVEKEIGKGKEVEKPKEVLSFKYQPIEVELDDYQKRRKEEQEKIQRAADIWLNKKIAERRERSRNLRSSSRS